MRIQTLQGYGYPVWGNTPATKNLLVSQHSANQQNFPRTIIYALFYFFQVTGTWSGSESGQSLLRVNNYSAKEGFRK